MGPRLGLIENDDARFGLSDVLGLAERTGIPVVWDVLHHRCHDPDRIPAAEALRLALATWHGRAPAKIHYSSPRTDVKERRERVGRRVRRRLAMPSPRAHADLIDPGGFEDLLNGPGAGHEFDVMLEAKAKDLALIRLRDQLCRRDFRWSRGRIERG
jgi:UV DNA damage endonuclease